MVSLHIFCAYKIQAEFGISSHLNAWQYFGIIAFLSVTCNRKWKHLIKEKHKHGQCVVEFAES